MQLATGFWASKTFLSAIELRVFGAFEGGPLGLDTSANFRAAGSVCPDMARRKPSSAAILGRHVCRLMRDVVANYSPHHASHSRYTPEGF